MTGWRSGRLSSVTRSTAGWNSTARTAITNDDCRGGDEHAEGERVHADNVHETVRDRMGQAQDQHGEEDGPRTRRRESPVPRHALRNTQRREDFEHTGDHSPRGDYVNEGRCLERKAKREDSNGHAKGALQYDGPSLERSARGPNGPAHGPDPIEQGIAPEQHDELADSHPRRQEHDETEEDAQAPSSHEHPPGLHDCFSAPNWRA